MPTVVQKLAQNLRLEIPIHVEYVQRYRVHRYVQRDLTLGVGLREQLAPGTRPETQADRRMQTDRRVEADLRRFVEEYLSILSHLELRQAVHQFDDAEYYHCYGQERHVCENRI